MTRSIMLVEDDDALRYSLSKYLITEGFQVLSVEDHNHALQALEKGHPTDLLITDLVLGAGRAHGISLALMARARRDRLPVIFITAFEDLAPNAASLGDVLMKPIDPHHLVTQVRRTLDAVSRG